MRRRGTLVWKNTLGSGDEIGVRTCLKDKFNE